MEKTIVVEIERRMIHPIFNKIVNRRAKIMVHDEERTAHIGDLVKVSETRPLSKRKRWRLVEIVRRAE